jgi:Arc/MetJ-type ribon-helix-helix transcriptional regulator
VYVRYALTLGEDKEREKNLERLEIKMWQRLEEGEREKPKENSGKDLTRLR